MKMFLALFVATFTACPLFAANPTPVDVPAVATSLLEAWKQEGAEVTVLSREEGAGNGKMSKFLEPGIKFPLNYKTSVVLQIQLAEKERKITVLVFEAPRAVKELFYEPRMITACGFLGRKGPSHYYYSLMNGNSMVVLLAPSIVIDPADKAIEPLVRGAVKVLAKAPPRREAEKAVAGKK